MALAEDDLSSGSNFVSKHNLSSLDCQEVSNLPFSDLSNVSKRPKRQASLNAEASLSKSLKRCAPRGDPSKSTPSRIQKLKEKQNATQQNLGDDCESLKSILKNKGEAFRLGSDAVQKFVFDNMTWTMSKALSVHMMSALSLQGMNIMEASQLTSTVTDFSTETVRKWGGSFYQAVMHRRDYDISKEWVEEHMISSRGCHPKTISLFEDEDFQLKSKEFVRSNSCTKGKPNLTAQAYATWINTNWHHEISEVTARQWLHKLGFEQQGIGKAVYFDGHERPDVVSDRNHYVQEMHKYDYPEPGEKPVIRVYHDESTFYANAGETFFWSDGTNAPIRSKSLGQAIMVSDFIDEQNGYLKMGDNTSRVYLEHSKEGYWNNGKFLEQVDKAIDVFEAKYPNACGLFIFDNAPSHRKMAADALNVHAMNAGPGGKQPVMRDTVWDGKVQKMTLDNGVPKGLRIVLQERGIDSKSMTVEQMCKELLKHEDFQAAPKSLLEERIEARNHKCMFLPRFHCELNPIEWVWCFAKQFTRQYCDGTITTLRKIVPQGLDRVTNKLIQKFFS